MRKVISLPSFTPITAGSDTSVTLKVGGYTYERVMFELTNVTPAQLKNIEVRVNGDAIQEFKDGQQVLDINSFYNRKIKSGFLTIWAIRPELTNIAQRRTTAWGTMNLQTLSIHMEIAEGVTAPKIKGHAVVTDARSMMTITKIKRFPYNAAVSGQVDIDNIPRGPRVMAMHLFKSDISDVEVEMDNVRFYDASKALSITVQEENGRVPLTDCTHVDFLGDNDLANALITANARDFRIKATLDTAGGADILVEYLESVV